MYCIVLLVHCSLFDCCSIACVLALGRAGRRIRVRGTRWVRFRGSSFRLLGELCRQDDHTLEITSFFALLVVRSIAMFATPTTCLSCLPYCHVKPLTHLVLANCCLAMLPLCSAPLIALLVAGEDGVCSLLEHVYCWISLIYLVYFNAPIYLVKGGRLGLMPSVLFYSCHPSFCHIGVMCPGFCVPYAVG